MSWYPSRTPTPSKYAVLLVAFLILLMLAGGVALVLAFTVAVDRPELAAELTHYGSWTLGIGAFLSLAVWLVRRSMD